MKPKLRIISLLLLAALAFGLLAGCVSAGESENPFDHSLSVTGTGEARVPPDIAVASIGVHVQNKDAGAAVDENNRKSNAVMDALKSLGIEDKDIQTTNFSIYTQDQYDKDGNPTGEVKYITDNTVTVTLRDLTKLGPALNAAIKAGANSIFGVNYTIEDQTATAAAARDKALADAKARAEQLAAGSGMTLGKVLTASESVVGGPVFSPEAFGKADGAGGGVPVSGGSITVQVQVYVTYELK